MSMEHWQNDSDGKNLKYLEKKSCSNTNFYTTNPIQWPGTEARSLQ